MNIFVRFVSILAVAKRFVLGFKFILSHKIHKNLKIED